MSVANIGQRSLVSSVALTTSVSPAYGVGDSVGGKITFPNTMTPLFGGVLQSIEIKSKAIQSNGFKLYLFDTDLVTTVTDNAAVSLNAADLPALLGVYSLVNYDNGLGTMTVYTLDGIGKIIASLNEQASTLYGILTTTAAFTAASTSDLEVGLGVIV